MPTVGTSEGEGHPRRMCLLVPEGCPTVHHLYGVVGCVHVCCVLVCCVCTCVCLSALCAHTLSACMLCVYTHVLYAHMLGACMLCVHMCCMCTHVYACVCGLIHMSAIHFPPQDPPLASKLGHTRLCVHSSAAPDRGLGEGSVTNAPVRTPRGASRCEAGWL